MSFTGGLPLNAILQWGAQRVVNEIGTLAIPPGYAPVAVPAFAFFCPRAGVFRSFTVRHNTANGNGALIRYLLRVGGVDTPLSVFLATGAVGNAFTRAQADVAAGALVECVRVIDADIGDDLLEVACAVEFMGSALRAGTTRY